VAFGVVMRKPRQKSVNVIAEFSYQEFLSKTHDKKIQSSLNLFLGLSELVAQAFIDNKISIAAYLQYLAQLRKLMDELRLTGHLNDVYVKNIDLKRKSWRIKQVIKH
jgi:hypothetical protein